MHLEDRLSTHIHSKPTAVVKIKMSAHETFGCIWDILGVLERQKNLDLAYKGNLQ